MGKGGLTKGKRLYTMLTFFFEKLDMNIFDIIGPVMIGPSSSHTAGAARIGYVASKLLGESPVHAHILLHGSFASTGLGHGTNRALVAGILGMKPDDERLRDSLEIAQEMQLEVVFENVELDSAHPNTTIIELTGKSGKKKVVEGASIGGGNIEIVRIDGHNLSISGHFPTIIVSHDDIPGSISKITRIVGESGYNIFQVHVGRDKRGGTAIMSLELDGNFVNSEVKQHILELSCAKEVTLLQPY